MRADHLPAQDRRGAVSSAAGRHAPAGCLEAGGYFACTRTGPSATFGAAAPALAAFFATQSLALATLSSVPALSCTYGHRDSAIANARGGVAHKTFDRAHHCLDVCFVMLQHVKQLFGAFSGIRSDNCVHVALPVDHGPARDRYGPARSRLSAGIGSGVVIGNDLPGNDSRFLIIDNGRKIDVHVRVPLPDVAMHGSKVVRTRRSGRRCGLPYRSSGQSSLHRRQYSPLLRRHRHPLLEHRQPLVLTNAPVDHEFRLSLLLVACVRTGAL